VADAVSNLAIGLPVAIGSAAAINLGFLLQHRGLARLAQPTGGTLATLRRSLAQPAWLAGQALGITGFTAQIAAVAIAPLALVQTFAAGGLALSVPLAVIFFKAPLRRSQALAVLAIAAALGSLPLGLAPAREKLSSPTLALILAVVFAATVMAARTGRPAGLAIAAGLSYGGADAAIKALIVLIGHRDATGVLVQWLPIAVLATGGGFVCFQRALAKGDAVSAVALMSALAALVALACGLVAFAEPFGREPIIWGGHLLAVGVVLACVWPLAAAQASIARQIG